MLCVRCQHRFSLAERGIPPLLVRHLPNVDINAVVQQPRRNLPEMRSGVVAV
jgi:hypothetical protein